MNTERRITPKWYEWNTNTKAWNEVYIQWKLNLCNANQLWYKKIDNIPPPNCRLFDSEVFKSSAAFGFLSKLPVVCAAACLSGCVIVAPMHTPTTIDKIKIFYKLNKNKILGVLWYGWRHLLFFGNRSDKLTLHIFSTFAQNRK